MVNDEYFDIPTMVIKHDPFTDLYKYELTVSTNVITLEACNPLDDWKMFNILKEQLIQEINGFTAFRPERLEDNGLPKSQEKHTL